MNKSIFKKINFKSNRGAIYIDLLITVFVLILVLAMAISVLPIIIQKNEINRVADEIARYVEISGTTKSIDAEVNQICADYGITIDDYKIDAPYENSSLKSIQLGDRFKITVERKTSIGLGGVISIPITLEAQSMGRSEVYWK